MVVLRYCLMHKVVILGCGWLGQQLGMALADAGYPVIGTRQSAASCAQLPPQIVSVELRLPALVFPAELVHDAIVIVALPASTPQYLQALKQISVACVKARQVFFCSSTGIYAGQAGHLAESALSTFGVVEDDTSPQPVAALNNDLAIAYHASINASTVCQLTRVQRLMAAEFTMLRLPHCVVLRLAGLIGPLRHPANFCQHGPLTGADWPVNMLHSADIQQFILQWLRQADTERLVGAVINLCCPEHPTKQQFYTQACLAAKVAAPHFLPTLPASQADFPRTIDVSKSLLLTGFNYKFLSPIQAIAYCSNKID
jgi:nucleoside-diphosphate-sugar epimerase